MKQLIYLDHNSSAPLAPEALKAMRPFLTTVHGNASSAHAAGRALAAAVEESREKIATLIGAQSDEIYFTSGGTESNNWMLGSLTEGHLVTSAVEHFSISENLPSLQSRGVTVAVVPVSREGSVDLEDLKSAVTAETKLVSLMLAQSEVGTIQPVTEAASFARSRGILFHTDAVQAVGKIPVDVRELGVDYLSISGHKLYGPKGIGVLFVRRGAPIQPWMRGAPHERGLRAGTLNVPGIVGLAAAAEAAHSKLSREEPRLRKLSRRLFEGLSREIPGIELNGAPIDSSNRLPNTVNVSFPEVRSFDLLQRIPEVAATGGPACHSSAPIPSRTLRAMGLSEARSLGAVRFSLGRSTTAAEIDRTVELFAAALRGSTVREDRIA